MEKTSYYTSRPQYINWDALPQYYYDDVQTQDRDYMMCCAEPMKYYEASVRREYKDLVFRLLMQDKKNLLSLYNALNKTDYRNEDELWIVTLEDAVYMKYKNDVSFLFQSYLMLYEHQSTFNPNMPLRNLFYVAAQLGREYRNKIIYSRKQIKIPVPRFVVFYNGRENRPEKEILKLSDAFERYDEEPELELKVHVININKGYNEEIMENCGVLREYSEFIDRIRVLHAELSMEEAIVTAVDECIQGGILKDFLLKQKAEVIETLLFEYNEEEALKAMKQQEYENGLEEGRVNGEAKGRENGIRAFVKLSKEVGLTKEEMISRVETEFSLEHKEAEQYVKRC